jgi:hypothetical protein
MTNIFLDNKYSNWYYKIINSAKSNPQIDVSEKHHIVPKSLGGSNDKNNLVRLTPKQHFICHRLLVKMTTGIARQKMVYAFWIMSNKKRSHIVSSNSYSNAKRLIQDVMSKRQITDEFRQQCSKRMSGTKMLLKTREALLKANTGKIPTNNTKQKLKSSLSEWYKNNTNTRVGQKRTEEQKKHISDAKKLSWQKKRSQLKVEIQ